MEDADGWLAHSPMSDPGRHAGAIAALPSDVSTLGEIVQGLLVHCDWAGEYGLDEAALGAAARSTMPVAERLDDVLGRDGGVLRFPRPADRRSVGTCRDFALLLCSFLRCKGIPARVRCGFAAYFDSGWEDHWVCEYRDRESGLWRLADAQIDRLLKQRNRITFDPANVPCHCFLPAGEVWLACRSGRAEPQAFGHGEVTGLWFVKVNVMRDHCVLNGLEVSGWDRWREAPLAARTVLAGELALLDDLAARPGQRLARVPPDWSV